MTAGRNFTSGSVRPFSQFLTVSRSAPSRFATSSCRRFRSIRWALMWSPKCLICLGYPGFGTSALMVWWQNGNAGMALNCSARGESPGFNQRPTKGANGSPG